MFEQNSRIMYIDILSSRIFYDLSIGFGRYEDGQVGEQDIDTTHVRYKEAILKSLSYQHK